MYPIDVLLFAFAPIPPPSPDPVGIAISVGSVILSLFGALFGGSAKREVAEAFNLSRDVQLQTTNTLMRFSWRIANALGRLLGAVQALYVRTIGSILVQLDRLMRRVAGIIDRVLRPYLNILESIRRTVERIYIQIFRPILSIIESTRRILVVLRGLGVPWAGKIDDKLARIEGKILAPLQIFLRRINTLGNWIGVIMSARGVLQPGVFLSSLDAYKSDLAAYVWEAHKPRSRPAGPVYPPAPAPAFSTRRADVDTYLSTGGGPLASRFEQAISRAQQLAGA